MKKRKLLIFTMLLFVGFVLNAQTKEEIVETKSKGPGTYKILKETNEPIRIPFTMHNGKPILDVEINGKKAILMIDNGILWDQIWLFGSPLVEELQLKPFEKSSIGGAGEGDPTSAYTSSNITLKFKDIIFYEQPVLVSPPAAGFNKMFPGAGGQLCNTFFKHFIVEFDFINNEIILHQPEQFKYTGEGSVLDLTLNESGTHAVPFSLTMLNGKVFNDKADVDFGGIHELSIALNNKNNIQIPAKAERIDSYGAQGLAPEYKGKIQSMTFGKYKFDEPTVFFGDEETSRIHPGNLGVLGLPLFMKFNIIFDYINNKLYITPNSKFDGLLNESKD